MNPDLTFIIEDVRHFRAVQLFWKQYGVRQRLSTGFYMVSSALSLCKKVHLFGFWPFGMRLSGERLSFHYYGESKSKFHDMSLEFKWLLSMHRNGMLQLYVDNCRSTNMRCKQMVREVGPRGGAQRVVSEGVCRVCVICVCLCLLTTPDIRPLNHYTVDTLNVDCPWLADVFNGLCELYDKNLSWNHNCCAVSYPPDIKNFVIFSSFLCLNFTRVNTLPFLQIGSPGVFLIVKKVGLLDFS